jgi:hypothetical protein
LNLEQQLARLRSGDVGRSRAGAVASAPPSECDADSSVFNQIIAHMSAENVRLQSKLDKAKIQLKLSQNL